MAKYTKKMEILKSLVERTNLTRDAREAFKKAYPNAPDAMIEVAIFHVYVDGIGAALDWLVSVEEFLRNPNSQMDGSHLLYHLYNWHQLVALLPEGSPRIIELIEDIKVYLNENEFQAALDSVEELEDRFKGQLNHPNFY
ncbi:hypothetical protein [Roseofilum sp. Guam]|uniref:hypothetical protein n=1 Tax=Roseofilum sp. Guam TaxID=2821502 RepID=UPI001B13C275|nr:hypothetical protein [Roseofilum sp. Guam]MBP0028877.1 hypothetical protein [Roseofilum sp. Guam]